MKPVSAAFLAVLASGERAATSATRLGGKEVGPQVESWSVEQSYGTDLPDAMRAFSGSTSAQLDVTVTGTGGKSAPSLYGPWAPRSSGDVARPGQSVVHGWGVNGTVLDTFRGTVRTRSAESGTDLVRLSALDGAERLRMPARLPYPDIPLKTVNAWTLTYTWITSATWVVDSLLRRAGIHTCPPPRNSALFYASMHGGASPDIGNVNSLTGLWSYWSRDAAPFESVMDATHLSSSADYSPGTRTVNRPADGLWLEGWANNSTGASSDKIVRYRLRYDTTAGNSSYVSFEVNFHLGMLTASHGTTQVELVESGWVITRVR